MRRERFTPHPPASETAALVTAVVVGRLRMIREEDNGGEE
jgi:hypothetical protein